MRGKLLFVAGIATGYIIGARAGRPAYDAVVERFQGLSGNPTVKKVGEKAKATLEDKAPKVADVVEKAADTAASAASAASEAGSAGDSSESDDAGSASSDGAAETPKPSAPKASTTPKPTQSGAESQGAPGSAA